MNAQTETLLLEGAAGAIEARRDLPAGTPCGIAVIAHPHPLFGGTLDNKVVQTLARAFVQCGWGAVRFNFRGVGASAGVHDAGQGEREDLLAVVRREDFVPAAYRSLAFADIEVPLLGNDAEEAVRQGHSMLQPRAAASRFQVAPVPPEAHLRTLVLHGEQDDTVPLADVLDWARPQTLPVTVIPGGGHFFHGQLSLLKNLVVRHLQSAV